MKQIKLFLLLFLFSGCTFFNAVSGRFGRFDSGEYLQIVEIEIKISESKTLCDKSALEIKEQLEKIDGQLKTLHLYASGRPYNDKTVKQINLLKSEIVKTKAEFDHDFSKKFCTSIFDNLEEMADILRISSGEKKL